MREAIETARQAPGSRYIKQQSNFTISLERLRADIIRIAAWLALVLGASC